MPSVFKKKGGGGELRERNKVPLLWSSSLRSLMCLCFNCGLYLRSWCGGRRNHGGGWSICRRNINCGRHLGCPFSALGTVVLGLETVSSVCLVLVGTRMLSCCSPSLAQADTIDWGCYSLGLALARAVVLRCYLVGLALARVVVLGFG